MVSGPITSWQIDGETMETVIDFILLGFKIMQMVTTAMKLKDIAPWKKNYDFASKGLFSQSYGFSSSHVWM